MKPQCRNGHPYTPENSRINSQGNRICVVCQKARLAAYQRRFKGRSGHIVRHVKAGSHAAQG